MASMKFEVAAFDGRNNFGLWRIKMLALLRREGSEYALDDSYPKGTSEADILSAEKKAHSAIMLSLSDKVLCEVGTEKTATSLWKKLETLYQKKSVTTRLCLKQRLFTFKMKAGTILHEHLEEFNKLVMDLTNADIKIGDEDLACVLLFSLTSAYKDFVNSMIYGRDTLTLEDVRSSLNSAELRTQMDGNEKEDQADGLMVRGRSNNKDSGKGKGKNKGRSKSRGADKKNIECYYCHKKGHYKSECFALKKKEDTASASTVEEGQKSNNGEDFVLTASCSGDSPSDKWIMDSACTYHMCYDRDWFTTYEKKNGLVLMGNNAVCKVIGIGSVRVRCHDNVVRTLTDVRHIPDLKKNLISLGTLDALGFKYTGDGSIIKVSKGSLIVLKAKLMNGLYVLMGSTVLGSANVSTSKLSDADNTRLWHMRLGHMSERGLTMLSNRNLLNGEKTSTLDFCEHCVFGKQKRVSFSTGSHKTEGVLDYIHSDLWGPSQVPSKGGKRYLLTFIDDFSRKVWVYFLKEKSDAFENFKNWKTLIENQMGKKIKCLRTDNGLEFCGGEFNSFCKVHGILRHRTVRGTPQQNGVAERMNRTLLEKARCMLSNAKLSKDFWAEAINTACFVVNRSPASAIEFKTPNEVWSGKPSDYSYLKVFGCPAYYHVKDGKLDPRAKKCLFMGYAEGVKGYRLWGLDPDSPKFVISRDVTFDETSMLDPRKVAVESIEKQVENTGEKTKLQVEPPEKEDQETQGNSELEDEIVDDMLIAAKSMSEIDTLKKLLSREFDMKDLGAAKKILGMEIQRKDGEVHLSQKRYIEKVLERFSMQGCKSVSTPLAPHFKLSALMSPQSQKEVEYMSKVPYSSAVGSIMYAMVCTRPDIAQAVSVVSRYMSNPGKTHWEAVKWILRYLKGASNVGLTFSKGSDASPLVLGYVDSDFAGDLDRRRSTTGYIFTLSGSAVSWKSTLQSIVALSTTEAEYMAAAEAVKEAIWLKGLVSELSLPQQNSLLGCDSQSAIHLIRNHRFHERTKHIDVRFHFIRDVVEEGVITVKKIGTEDNAADMLTKIVPLAKFSHCKNLAGVRII